MLVVISMSLCYHSLVCHHGCILIFNVIVSDRSSQFVSGISLADLHQEDNSDDDEGNYQDDVEDEDTGVNCSRSHSRVVVGGDGTVLYLFDVGGVHNLGRGSTTGRVFNVDEVGGSDRVSLLLSGHFDLLVSTEVLVQGLESGEGVEHLRSVGSRSFGGEGVVGEVVAETGLVGGWESTDLVLSVLLRSSSMGKDTGSAVTSRVERSSFIEVSLVHGVVFSFACVTSSLFTEFSDGTLVLRSHLHVNQVHDVNVRGSDVGGSLSPGEDVGRSEVGIGASEWKIFVSALSVEHLEHSVGIVVSTDVVDATSHSGIGSSSVDRDLGVGRTSKGLGSIKHRSDVRVVNNGITGLVVVVIEVGLRLESKVGDDLGVPS